MGEPQHVGSTFGSLSLTGCFRTNMVIHSSGMLHTCFQLNCCETKGPINLFPSTPHHTFTENLIWKFVSCGLLRDHVCTFRKLFTPSRVKDASSLNKITPNSSGRAFIQCAQIHTLSIVAWFQMYPFIMVRIQIFM